MTAEIPKEPARVPVGELRELVAEWREDSNNPDLAPMARHNAWDNAKRLTEVIEKYE